MKVYLAGPMTGIPDSNFPAFHAAAKAWRERGMEIRFNGDVTLPYATYIRAEIQHLLEVDAVAFLPGWRTSKGATFEHSIATMLGLTLFDAVTFKALESESILNEAERLVGGDRGKDYGHPIDDFTRTGRMWGAIIGCPDVPPDRVAMCMVALKMSRECNAPKRDNRTDMAGYTKTLDMVRERQGDK